MNQTAPTQENQLPVSPNITPDSPNITPDPPNSDTGYNKCLICDDLGSTCNGPSLRSLGSISGVRAYHKSLRKIRKIPISAIAKVATQISAATINEYFSNDERDYKWTTVSQIDNALLAICGNRIGLPPLLHACPASTSEVRQQMAAADMKIAAAELKLAQSETDMLQLQQKLTDTKGKHIAQIAQLEATHVKNIEWMKEDCRLWRRFAFLLLGIGTILLIGLVFFIGWHVAHPV
jgi:hypothetical protein